MQVDIKHLKKVNKGNKHGLEKWAVESLTQVYFITFLTVRTSDLAAPAVSHLAAVSWPGENIPGAKMKLVAHKTQFAGISVVKGMAKMVGYNMQSFGSAQQNRFKQVSELRVVRNGSSCSCSAALSFPVVSLHPLLCALHFPLLSLSSHERLFFFFSFSLSFPFSPPPPPPFFLFFISSNFFPGNGASRGRQDAGCAD